MAETVYAVAAKHVEDTGRVSFRFKAIANVPYADRMAFPLYGLLRREEKERDEVNPWRLARGEADAIGPDGFQKWAVFLFDSGGQILYTKADEDKAQEAGLQSLLKDLPNCMLLIEEAVLATLQT